MRTHQVEVDDEVFAFVKSHAEPLVDTFNTSLRRLLPLASATAPKRQSAPNPPVAGTPSFPGGTPQALRQIIEVAVLVLGGAYTRQSATQAVAKRHGVATQTVLDKYGRQLGLTASQFDRLLDQPGHKELKQLLRSKFPGHQEAIDRNLQ
jgi:negative regulator of replication initiation